MKNLFRLFKRKPKQMSFDEFAERAQRIVPIDYSVFCEFKKVRYNHVPNEKQDTTYSISLITSVYVAGFESNCPKKASSKLKNYFDTL